MLQICRALEIQQFGTCVEPCTIGILTKVFFNKLIKKINDRSILIDFIDHKLIVRVLTMAQYLTQKRQKTSSPIKRQAKQAVLKSISLEINEAAKEIEGKSHTALLRR